MEIGCFGKVFISDYWPSRPRMLEPNWLMRGAQHQAKSKSTLQPNINYKPPKLYYTWRPRQKTFNLSFKLCGVCFISPNLVWHTALYTTPWTGGSAIAVMAVQTRSPVTHKGDRFSLKIHKRPRMSLTSIEDTCTVSLPPAGHGRKRSSKSAAHNA